MVTDIQLLRLLSPSTIFALLPIHFSTPIDPTSLLTDIPTLNQGYNFFKDVQHALKACSELMEELDIAPVMLVEPRRQSGGQREGLSVCIAVELQNDLGSVGFRFESVSQSKIQVHLQDMLQVGFVGREENQSALRRSEAKFWEFFSLF